MMSRYGAIEGWHDEGDREWFTTLSANEWILAHDEDSPVLSGERSGPNPRRELRRGEAGADGPPGGEHARFTVRVA